MNDPYEKIVNIILGVSDGGTLNIPKNENTDKIISFLELLIKEKYFWEYGFDIHFIKDFSAIKKESFLNDRLLTRYPHVNTYGKLKLLVNNPDLYKKYDDEIRLRSKNGVQQLDIESG